VDKELLEEEQQEKVEGETIMIILLSQISTKSIE